MEDLKLDVLAMRPERHAMEPTAPTKPSRQIRKNTALKGVNSLQLGWWFQHIADGDGTYWKSLSPRNQSIRWVVSREEATNHVGKGRDPRRGAVRLQRCKIK